MATIEKRGNKYRVLISETQANGNQKLVTVGLYLTKTEAKAAANKAEVKKAKGSLLPKTQLPLHQYMEHLFRAYKEEPVSLGTYKKYMYTIKQVKDFFGG